MPRLHRVDVGGNYYHVLNRANARLQIFFNEDDYVLFEGILEEACEIFQIELLSYAVMPNHFHLVLKTQVDGSMGLFMKWLTQTHTSHWHKKNKTIGTGSLYQGRYKSFIIQEDGHLFTVIRYVERNPLTANLVQNLLNWQYSSFWRREKGTNQQKKFLASWPIDIPENYGMVLHQALSLKEIEKLEQSEERSVPYGDEAYILDTQEKYGIHIPTRVRSKK